LFGLLASIALGTGPAAAQSGKKKDPPPARPADRIVTESATFFAKYRNADGVIVTKPTECRDRQAAEQLLKKWEREVEQVKAGTLDRRALDAARRAKAPLEDHLSAYEQSLVAAGVSDVYRQNVLRAVRKLAADCGFAAPADLDREAVEGWLADRIGEGMSARTRNYYRESVVAFANWCISNRRLKEHIPKRDDRGRTIDVHAMRTTFGTLLSKTGTAPRTAQAAMRHSDIKLTMGVYTDPRLLDVRGAVEKLPALPLPKGPGPASAGTLPMTGTDGCIPTRPDSVAPAVAPAPFPPGHSVAIAVTEGLSNVPENAAGGVGGSACPVNDKPPVASSVTGGHRVGLTGFEPATSWSRTCGTIARYA
jgi:hypothetical protein